MKGNDGMRKRLIICLLIFLLIFSMSSCTIVPVEGDEELDNTDVDNSTEDDDGSNADIPDIETPEDEEKGEEEEKTDEGDETEKEEDEIIEDEEIPEPEAKFEYIKYDIDFSLYERPELIKDMASSDLTLDTLTEIKAYFIKNKGSIEACIDKYGIPYAFDPMQKELFYKNIDGTLFDEEKSYDYYEKLNEKGSFFYYNNLGVMYVAEEEGEHYALILLNEPTNYVYSFPLSPISTYTSSYFKELATDLNNFKWVNGEYEPEAVATSFDPYGQFYTSGSGDVTCHSYHLTADGYCVRIYYGYYSQQDKDNIIAQKISIHKV